MGKGRKDTGDAMDGYSPWTTDRESQQCERVQHYGQKPRISKRGKTGMHQELTVSKILGGRDSNQQLGHLK